MKAPEEKKPVDPVKYPMPGRLYRHYKGGIYEFLFMATHSETNEPLIVYKSVLFGTHYVRPLSMWFEEVSKHVKRFELL